MMIWAVAAIAAADSQTTDNESAEQLRGYQSELESTWKDAESSTDASLNTLLDGIDRLTSNIDLEDMVAQVQR